MYHVVGLEPGERAVADPSRAYIREVQGAIIRPPVAAPPEQEEARRLCPVTEHSPVDLSSFEGAEGDGGVEPFRLAWPISDVEPFNRSKIPDTRSREALALKAKELWIEEARPEKMGVQPLPDLVDCDNVREFLRRAQLDSGEFRPVIDQLRAGLDPEGSARGRPERRN